ncbi:YueI family protein [Limosilactobacillus caecicola]|uniref:YueI family protein n=1 Tax=Limosilactobacillus caecicola TaxID=2941332 RepID=UPI002040AACF|nr:YueI family protein [Limosilactobacillus caecicola]
MADNKSNIDQRIQNSVYGTPKIKPDEQRRYMGTFRERVWLTITVAEAKQRDWSNELQTELTAHPDSLVIINGNISDQFTRPYLMVANTTSTQFTIKTGAETKTADDNFAVVVTDHKAVYQSPVDVAKKYGHSQPASDETSTPTQPSFFKRLFHLK